MPLKNILVSWNATPAAEAALGVAMLMARKYDAWLTGVLSYGPQEMIASYAGYLPSGVAEQVLAADRERRRQIEADFRARTASLPPERTAFLDVFGSADDGLMEVSRVYDLIVMGSAAAESEIPHMEPHPDVVARHSGRPVLVVPRDYRTGRLNEHALVAWDGGRAAARALADAMRLLETKERVTVLTIGQPGEAVNMEGILRHLTRHGIAAEARVVERGARRIADCILDTARELGAGLVVMGAYEHSKFAEDLFGGVTNRILAGAPVPVLMSH